MTASKNSFENCYAITKRVGQNMFSIAILFERWKICFNYKNFAGIILINLPKSQQTSRILRKFKNYDLFITKFHSYNFSKDDFGNFLSSLLDTLHIVTMNAWSTTKLFEIIWNMFSHVNRNSVPFKRKSKFFSSQ